MDILLLRHGKAADTGGTPVRDEERPLTAAGREQLAEACATCCRAVPAPTLILASPLLRAQQSAAVLSAAMDCDPQLETCDVITPASRPSQVLERLHEEALAGTSCVALVGHEPHLGSLLGLLLTGDERYSLPLRKAMMVWVELDSPQTMLGRLRLCLAPKDAAKL